MKIFRNSLAVAVLTALVLALFGLAFGGGATAARTETDRLDTVKYLSISAGTYNLDPAHTLIGFSVRHLEINWVEGRFKDFAGAINFDEKDLTRSSVAFSAKIDSVDTGIAARDAHLKTADFFDAAKYPEMTFKSTNVQKKGKGYVLYGDLTIKGVTKPVSFPFTMTGAIKDPWGGTRFGVDAEAKINRRDFGINFGNPLPVGGFDVGDEVTIKLRFEAVKAPK